MFMNLLELFVESCRHQGIQVLLLDSSYTGIMEIDFGLRRKMTEDFDYAQIAVRMEQTLEEGVQYYYTDELNLSYCIFRFPAQPAEEYGCHVLLIGPVLSQPVESAPLHALMEKNHIPADSLRELLEFYSHIPLIPGVGFWTHSLLFFLEKLQGSSVPFRIVSYDSPELFALRYEDYSIPDTPEPAPEAVGERYQREDAMLAAVAAGNLEEASRHLYHLIQYRQLPRNADHIRESRNRLLSLNTLLQKTVRDSQVHPMHTDNLFRQLAAQIETLSSTGQLNAFPLTMLRKYCLLINNYSRRSCSQLVRVCMDDIDFHYNEDLSLGILARSHAVSASYLSGLFRQETGMTLTDYINHTRIRQALILLNTTGLPVGAIAARCGFPDSSYFSRIFKKYQGKTPREYRKSIRG